MYIRNINDAGEMRYRKKTYKAYKEIALLNIGGRDSIKIKESM